jgi:hypothetical protein
MSGLPVGIDAVAPIAAEEVAPEAAACTEIWGLLLEQV